MGAQKHYQGTPLVGLILFLCQRLAPCSYLFGGFKNSLFMPFKIAAIVVTHNRPKLLAQCVEALRSQTRRPDWVIVVGNDVCRETRAWLDKQPELLVYHQANLGSAGGQKTGIRKAMEHGADWAWCMDDDSLPSPNALERLLDSPAADRPDTGFLASVVKWTDGSLHSMNLMQPLFVGRWLGTILTEKCLPVAHCSFVGVMFHRRAVEGVGLPIAEMFIWGDDIEYTRRVSKLFVGYGVLDSIVFHQTVANAGADTQLDESDNHSMKIRCLYRNNVALHFAEASNLFTGTRRALMWMFREIQRSRTFARRITILLNGLRGVPFYFKYVRSVQPRTQVERSQR
jgi:glycosyltransferase involved in cell wall biosynthesis